MNFLKIEQALNKLVGESITDGRFYQTAGVFESILSDSSLKAEEKAEKIARLIEGKIR